MDGDTPRRGFELVLDPAVLVQLVALSGIIANVILSIHGKRSSSKETRQLKKALGEQIDSNTQLTVEAKDKATDAYREANNVNLKIAALAVNRDPHSRTRRGDEPGEVERKQ